MKIDTIFELWEQDSKIDPLKLTESVTGIGALHHKYFKIMTHERLLLRSLEFELKTLKLKKTEFYTQGPTEETHKLGWKLPASGKVLKTEVSTYVDADPDIIELSIKIGIQNEKTELLESIIKTIGNRSYQVSAAVNWERFKAGV